MQALARGPGRCGCSSSGLCWGHRCRRNLGDCWPTATNGVIAPADFTVADYDAIHEVYSHTRFEHSGYPLFVGRGKQLRIASAGWI